MKGSRGYKDTDKPHIYVAFRVKGYAKTNPGTGRDRTVTRQWRISSCGFHPQASGNPLFTTEEDVPSPVTWAPRVTPHLFP